ncbi:MAG: penicillin-binding protein 1A [Halanaerobiales bacterium]|nr:penicillin-binding protein 1A [Halanaerobiales bacterium]
MSNKKGRYIIVALILIISLTMGVFIGAISWIIKDTPDITNYKGSSETTVIYSSEGEELTKLYRENRTYVSLDKIPAHLKEAIVAIEDKNFYVHNGVDFFGILRAVVANIRAGYRAQGASTITQQLARNALLHQQKTYYRKIQEAYLALQFERKYTKPEILEMYLNEIFMGHSAYGVQAAANQYFGKDVSELTLSESALIAGLPRAPNYYSPYNNKEKAIERRNVVLNKMVELGYLDKNRAEQAKQKELTLKSKNDGSNDLQAPYYIRYVRDTLLDMYGANMVYGSGLKVYTTLDTRMQEIANNSIDNAIQQKYIPTVNRKDSADPKQPQMALVTIDSKTGAIRSMVGGRGDDQFNRAVQAVRQPGSAFKPFVYTTAVKNNYSPADIINDMPMANPKNNDSEDKEIWPTNFGNEYRGLVSLREGLTHSINVAAVKLLQKIGVSDTISTARKMGINTFEAADNYSDHYSLALGGLNRGVKPLEMATAYGVLANNGIKTEPFAITKILDRDGRVIYEAHPNKEIVLSSETSYLMTDMLRSVINQGTGWRADLDRPVAGKTGTTNNYTDAWFVGYTPDLVTSVWIGEDNLQEMVYDEKDSNGNYIYSEGNGPRTISSSEAARLWGEYMRKVVEGREVAYFSKPNNLESVSIDPITGKLPNKYTPKVKEELFKKENVPREAESLHGPVETARIDKNTGYLATSNCPEENIVEYTYIEKSGIRLGPTQINFRETNDGSTDPKNLTKGVYMVEEGEPIQIIDSQLGIPKKNNNGDVQYETKPTQYCPEHPSDEEVETINPEDSVIFDIWEFLNEDKGE